MNRFEYHSIIQRRDRSDFREWPADHDCYLLLAVSGLKTEVLVESAKWDELRSFPTSPDETVAIIQKIANQFVNNYRKSQKQRDPKGHLRNADEIIESLGLLWLNRAGDGYVYQAGKCRFEIMRPNGYTVPAGQPQQLEKVTMHHGDSLVLDVKRADVSKILKNTFSSIKNPEEVPEEINQFNYPFAFLRAEAVAVADIFVEPEIVFPENKTGLPAAGPEIAATEIPPASVPPRQESETPPAVTYTVQPSSKPKQRQPTAKPAENELAGTGSVYVKHLEAGHSGKDSGEHQQSEPKKTIRKTSIPGPAAWPVQLGIALFILLPAIGAVWYVYQNRTIQTTVPEEFAAVDSVMEDPEEPASMRQSREVADNDLPDNAEDAFPSADSSQPDEVTPSETSETDNPVMLMAAETAMQRAEQHMRDGENSQALDELDNAKKNYMMFIKQHPEKQDSIRSRIFEIDAKRRLIQN